MGDRPRVLLLALGLLWIFALCACAAPTIVRYAPDTYRAVAALGWTTDAETRATRAAVEYCATQEKEMLPLHSAEIAGAQELHFRCLSPGDPELQKPTVGGEPDAR